jgi:dipicolinate synthase subunit B
MENKRVGFAVCGSFCTHKSVIKQMEVLKQQDYDIIPIVSPIVYETDTRFGEAETFIKTIEEICNKKCIHTVKDAEPIGPKQLLDILLIAPCTGNTLGKLACGITDTSVTMAAKAHLRNERPLIIAPSTNDALGASAKNIGLLLNCKNVFFVPFKQDMPESKHNSCISDFSLIPQSIAAALKGQQLQPILIQ